MNVHTYTYPHVHNDYFDLLWQWITLISYTLQHGTMFITNVVHLLIIYKYETYGTENQDIYNDYYIKMLLF